jgi:lactate racemase
MPSHQFDSNAPDAQVPGDASRTFHLKYGRGHESLDVPVANFGGAIEPREMAGTPDATTAIREALANPVRSSRLAERVRSGNRVVVVVSDVTRPAPSDLMLPPLLDELNAAGVPDSDIVVTFAVGTHRRHTAAERIRLVGEAAYGRVRCIDYEPDDFVEVGTTRRGTPVRATRMVVEADFRVLTGNVEYHWFAGYSGGGKALVPGVCDRETVRRNHSMMVEPGAHAGRIAGNPVREDIDEAADLIGADFALNVVLNVRREIVRAVAGAPRSVVAEAAKTVDELNGVPLAERADIVVASAGGYPKDINVYQAQKAIDNARLAVKPGGTLILVADCGEGLGESTFAEWMAAAKEPRDLIERLRGEFVIGGHKAAGLALALVDAELCLVSVLDEAAVRGLFCTSAPTAQAALDRALAKHGAGARVLVMPSAGSTLPLVGGV